MKETDASSELNRYRQAADVAYRYAKNKLERNTSPEKKQEDEEAFKPVNKEESQR